MLAVIDKYRGLFVETPALQNSTRKVSRVYPTSWTSFYKVRTSPLLWMHSQVKGESRSATLAGLPNSTICMKGLRTKSHNMKKVYHAMRCSVKFKSERFFA